MKQERAQKPEINIADDREREHAILANQSNLVEQIAERIPSATGSRAAPPAHAKSRGWSASPTHASPIKIAPDQYSRPSRAVESSSGNQRAKKNREKCASFESAIAPGKLRFGQQFRQQTIFRRAEERRLRADQKIPRHIRSASCAAPAPRRRAARRPFRRISCRWSPSVCCSGRRSSRRSSKKAGRELRRAAE